MLSLLLATFASAGPMDAWDNSRWLVEIEETLPLQLPIAGPDTNPPVVRAIQAQAVFACPEASAAGKKAVYVTCKLEDLALRFTPQAPPGARKAEYESALANIKTVLTEGTFEIKVKEDGRVPSIDFEPKGNLDQIVVEATRSLAIDLFTGFSLYRADVPAGTPWEEKNSPLIRAATQPLGVGLTKITHKPQALDGMTALTSEGDGTYQSFYMSWGAGRVEQLRGSAGAGGAYGSMANGVMAQTRNFDAYFGSKTVLDDNGPFLERMWNLTSEPKQDQNDMSGVAGTPLWAAGHIKRLGKDEKVELGESGLISAPGATFEGYPEWKPLLGG